MPVVLRVKGYKFWFYEADRRRGSLARASMNRLTFTSVRKARKQNSG
jgi:hypothetical protein